MSLNAGQWLSLDEYAERSGKAKQELHRLIDERSLVKKEVRGLELIWMDEPGGPEAPQPTQKEAEAEKVATGAESHEIIAQTERALTLVEKSLSTFMLMHQELLAEKERIFLNMEQSLVEKEQIIRDKVQRIQELEQTLHKTGQELADLRMLVSLLEDQLNSARERLKAAEELQLDQSRDLGDMMEDQLKYIMEEQMISELSKE